MTETEAAPAELKLAAELYADYIASSGNKNFRGDPCPTWAELPSAIRGHWCAVARGARQRLSAP